MPNSGMEVIRIGGRPVIVEYNARARSYFIITPVHSFRFGLKNGREVVKLLKVIAD